MKLPLFETCWQTMTFSREAVLYLFVDLCADDLIEQEREPGIGEQRSTRRTRAECVAKVAEQVSANGCVSLAALRWPTTLRRRRCHRHRRRRHRRAVCRYIIRRRLQRCRRCGPLMKLIAKAQREPTARANDGMCNKTNPRARRGQELKCATYNVRMNDSAVWQTIGAADQREHRLVETQNALLFQALIHVIPFTTHL
jgi:hypothetical protein